jgi:hypothetical protein
MFCPSPACKNSDSSHGYLLNEFKLGLSLICKGCTVQGLEEAERGVGRRGASRTPKVLIKVKQLSLSLPRRTFCFIPFTFFTAHLPPSLSCSCYLHSFSFRCSFELGNESGERVAEENGNKATGGTVRFR